MIFHLLHLSCALITSLLEALPFIQGFRREDAKNAKLLFNVLCEPCAFAVKPADT
jgi:hypothetical protein